MKQRLTVTNPLQKRPSHLSGTKKAARRLQCKKFIRLTARQRRKNPYLRYTQRALFRRALWTHRRAELLTTRRRQRLVNLETRLFRGKERRLRRRQNFLFRKTAVVAVSPQDRGKKQVAAIIKLTTRLSTINRLLPPTQTTQHPTNARLFKKQVINGLLCRKQYAYRRRALQSLKASRAAWLRRAKTVARTTSIARTTGKGVAPTSTLSTKRRTRIKLRSSVINVLVGRSRRARTQTQRVVKLLRSRRPIRHFKRSAWRAPRRKRLMHRYKIYSRRARCTRRRTRQQRVMRRMTPRARQNLAARREILIATREPVRRYLHYKRLQLTQRVAAVLLQLRAPYFPWAKIRRAQQKWRKELRIVASWHTTRNWLLRNRYSGLRRADKIKVAPAPARTRVLFPRIGVPRKPRKSVATSVRLQLNRPKATMRAPAPVKLTALLRPRRVSFFTAALTAIRHDHASQSKRLARSTNPADRAPDPTGSNKKGRPLSQLQRIWLKRYNTFALPEQTQRRKTIHRLAKVLRAKRLRRPTRKLRRNRSNKHLRVSYSPRRPCLAQTRERYNRAIARLSGRYVAKQRALKKSPAYVRKGAQHRRATLLVTQRAYRIAEYRRKWSTLTPRAKTRGATYKAPIPEQLRLHAVALMRTYRRRAGLTHAYNVIENTPRLHLFDPKLEPVSIAKLPPFSRRTRRCKRAAAKQSRETVVISKRTLRGRSRKKVVIVLKRVYSYTNRSPVHTGRTVPWKKRKSNRSRIYGQFIAARAIFRKLVRSEQTSNALRTHGRTATQLLSAAGLRLVNTVLLALLRFCEQAPPSTKSAPLAELRTRIRFLLRQGATVPTAELRFLVGAVLAAQPHGNVAAKQRLLATVVTWKAKASTAFDRMLKTHPALIAKSAHQRTVTSRRARSLRRRTIKNNVLLSKRLSILSQTVDRRTQRRLYLRQRTVKFRHLRRQQRFRSLRARLRPKRWYTTKKKARRVRQKKYLTRCWGRVRRYRARHRRQTTPTLRRFRLRLRQELQRRADNRVVRPRARLAGKFVLRARKTQRRLPIARFRSILNVPQMRTISEAKAIAWTLHVRKQRRQNISNRLAYAQLHAQKALLWKLPLPTAALPTSGRHIPHAHWHSKYATKLLLKVDRQVTALRIMIAPPAPRSSTLPTEHLLARYRRATRRNSRVRHVALRFRGARRDFRVKQLPITRPIGRLSRFSRAGAYPKRLRFWAVSDFEARKKKMTQTAHTYAMPTRRRRHRRSVSFKKNRLFMRRRSTRGRTLTLLDDLRRLQGYRKFVNRPLTARLRRSKPLRRSIRRQLAVKRSRKRHFIRYQLSRSSTGRALAQLTPSCFRRTYWIRKLRRVNCAAVEKRVQTFNRLLTQFEQLPTTVPFVLGAPSTRRAREVKQRTTKKIKILSPVRTFLRAHRRAIRAFHRRSRSVQRHTSRAQFTRLQKRVRHWQVKRVVRAIKPRKWFNIWRRRTYALCRRQRGLRRQSRVHRLRVPSRGALVELLTGPTAARAKQTRAEIAEEAMRCLETGKRTNAVYQGVRGWLRVRTQRLQRRLTRSRLRRRLACLRPRRRAKKSSKRSRPRIAKRRPKVKILSKKQQALRRRRQQRRVATRVLPKRVIRRRLRRLRFRFLAQRHISRTLRPRFRTKSARFASNKQRRLLLGSGNSLVIRRHRRAHLMILKKSVRENKMSKLRELAPVKHSVTTNVIACAENRTFRKGQKEAALVQLLAELAMTRYRAINSSVAILDSYRSAAKFVRRRAYLETEPEEILTEGEKLLRAWSGEDDIYGPVASKVVRKVKLPKFELKSQLRREQPRADYVVITPLALEEQEISPKNTTVAAVLSAVSVHYRQRSTEVLRRQLLTQRCSTAFSHGQVQNEQVNAPAQFELPPLLAPADIASVQNTQRALKQRQQQLFVRLKARSHLFKKPAAKAESKIVNALPHKTGKTVPAVPTKIPPAKFVSLRKVPIAPRRSPREVSRENTAAPSVVVAPAVSSAILSKKTPSSPRPRNKVASFKTTTKTTVNPPVRVELSPQPQQPHVVKSEPLPTKTHVTGETVVSLSLMKKIQQFNKATSAETKDAYNALMSGVKLAWTELKDTAPGTATPQKEQDAAVLEQLYRKHYGPVTRYNYALFLSIKEVRLRFSA